MAERAPVIVVAGAAGGLGRAVVAQCRARSATVAALVRRRSADPSPAAAEIVVDVTDRAAVSAAVNQIGAELGPITGLVNTVAVQDLGRLNELTDSDWDTMMAVNLKGAHNLTRAAADAIIRTGSAGAIVHLASIEGYRPAPAHGHYAASKAALLSYVKAAAVELGPQSVRVNSVSPGLCHRDGIEKEWPDGVRRWLATAPLGRLVLPDDVARACWFLLSGESAGITGVDLIVDGGVLATAGW